MCWYILCLLCFTDANLIHAFDICIHRLVTVKRQTYASEMSPKGMLRKLLLHICFVWLISIVLVALPFLIFAKFGKRLETCSLNTIFQNDYIVFLAIINTIFMVPQVGMNIVYIYMLKFLMVTWRRINGLNDKRLQSKARLHKTALSHFNTDTSTPDVSNATFLNKTKYTLIESNVMGTDSNYFSTVGNTGCPGNKSQTGSSKHPEYEASYSSAYPCGADFIKSNYTDNISLKGNLKSESFEMREQTHSKIKEIPVTARSRVNKTHEDKMQSLAVVNQHAENQSRRILHLRKDDNASRESKRIITGRTSRRLGIKGQKEVLWTIGMLLLVLNIFMTPLNFLCIIELINDGLLTRQVKFILMALSLMNSALNPVIYTLRIKPFRDALKNSYYKLVDKICFS